MKIGFIGLGVMGSPMAGHLRAGGHDVFGMSRSGVSDVLVKAGVEPFGTPEAVAEAADVIFTMVPDTPDVEAVLFGKAGVIGGLRRGKTVVDMSSISPRATKEFASRVEDLGCDYLDAPVSGGEVGAKAASLSIMVGGRSAVFDRIRPLFELMGKNITLVGQVGDGQTAKVANQIVVALTIEAVAEGLLFAAKAGANPEKVRRALMGGLATSRVLEVHGERMIKRTFDSGFRIALHQKDLGLALSNAQQLGLYLPGTANAQQLFSVCAAHGGVAWDHSALVRALEISGNCKVSGEPEQGVQNPEGERLAGPPARRRTAVLSANTVSSPGQAGRD